MSRQRPLWPWGIAYGLAIASAFWIMFALTVWIIT